MPLPDAKAVLKSPKQATINNAHGNTNLKEAATGECFIAVSLGMKRLYEYVYIQACVFQLHD
jgi:hypothetical protein